MMIPLPAAAGRRACVLLLAFGLLACSLRASALQAQEPAAPVANTAPPAVDLGQCLDMAMARQPALAAARASLAAARDSRAALDQLGPVAGLLAHDLPVRRQQACLGITIAQASLAQTEWETRYAVIRNYYSVLYARLQQDVLEDAIKKLQSGRKVAEGLVKDPPPDSKVTRLDVDILDLQLETVRIREVDTERGVDKALVALREAIGLGPDFPLQVVNDALPAPVDALDKDALIAAALHGRGEVAQVNAANRITELEVEAQGLSRSRQMKTFAAGSDIHAKNVPQGTSNGDYKPGALGLEMPPFLVGRKADRMQRASDLSGRASAVVDKTNNLVALEVESYYLKWLEAKQKIDRVTPMLPKAVDVGNRVLKRFERGEVTGEEYLRAQTLSNQLQAQYNEALYNHALALAALERATAGAYRVPVLPAPPAGALPPGE